jgi:hypothetical protein
MADEKEEQEVSEDTEKSAVEKDDAFEQAMKEVDLTTGDDEPEEQETQETDSKEKQEVKEEKEKQSIDPVMKQMQDRLTRLENDKSNLKKALHEERASKKEKKEEPILTDAELMTLIKEHKDDPEVMFNAMLYKMQHAVKGEKEKAINEVEIGSRQKEFNKVLRDRYPDFDNEDSPIRQNVEKAKDFLSIKDHPHSDLLAASAVVFGALPNIINHWYEEGKKASMDKGVDAARKKEIKEGQLIPSGDKSGKSKSSQDLNQDQLDTAKRLGFDKDPKKLFIYKSQILKLGKKA